MIGRKSDHGFKEIGSFTHNEIPKIARIIEKSGDIKPNVVIICSVCPKIDYLLSKKLEVNKSIKLIKLGRHASMTIKSKYMNISKLGSDRKVNLYGAVRLMKPPLLIFDFGTATTVDYISAKGAFEGGMIIPGINMSLQALHEKTALLPAVRLRKVSKFIGRDTRTGMLTGVLQGYGAMVNGLIDAFRVKYRLKKIRTIGTGGLVDIISRYCNEFDLKDRLFTLRSIVRIYEDRIGSSHRRNAGK